MTNLRRTSNHEPASPNVNASMTARSASVAATISPTGGLSSSSDRRRRNRPSRKPHSIESRTTATVVRKTPPEGDRVERLTRSHTVPLHHPHKAERKHWADRAESRYELPRVVS